MTQTFTQEHRAKLEEYLATHTLPSGLGAKESACSIAAINLALSGELTDEIPDCMSDVLGRAAIALQDAMPGEMRNSERYKALLPEMAGTGRKHEQERLAILLDWMWSVVLPKLQPFAESKGFGDAWKNMCQLKTAASALAAAAAARVADVTRAADYAAASNYAADAAADYASAYAAAAAAAADYSDDSAYSYAAAAATAADYSDDSAYYYAAADYASDAAAYAAADAGGDFWETVDPIGALERMTYLNEETSK
jgi:hypothetical protein